MSFYVCNYHLVWATKQRASLLVDAVETLVFTTIMQKSAQLDCPIHAIGGVADHIHVVVSIGPSRAVAEWARQVKGASSHQVNAMFPDLDQRFRWQKSYGVVTLGSRSLPRVTDYVIRQKEHHRDNTLWSIMERMDL